MPAKSEKHRVQPIWTSNVPQGDELLHQYEVGIDGLARW